MRHQPTPPPNRPEPAPQAPPLRVLVSACLLGERVRHDGGHRRSDDGLLARWQAEGRIVPLCPEVAGGLPVPRAAAEIEPGASAVQVLDGRAQVCTASGAAVTTAFLDGAEAAWRLVRRHGIRIAVLKEGSPSCGSQVVHDGRFAGIRVAGQGVTTARLVREGVQVFGEDRLAEAALALAALEAEAGRAPSGSPAAGHAPTIAP